MIAAIVQARMSSTRLPGKVLREILGKPMLWHLINRLKKSHLIEKIIVATSIKEIDRPILGVAQECGVEFFAGSEDDVLDRYYQAASKFCADPIIRITADCPLIDPKVIDKLINCYLKNKGNVDYGTICIPPTYPDGLDAEIFSFAALEKAWKEAKKQTEREYVTSYIWKNNRIFRQLNVACDEDLSHMRWTVDEEKDFLFVSEIYKGLYKSVDKVFYMQDILDFLKAHPEIAAINQGIGRNEGYIKSLRKEGADIEKEFLPWKRKA
ncbi:MAG: glycosyltransferase family protein [Candidatus Omnitrophica bacterium]|nr:glycosyltransferase family protein [Candidatus Omnitrophota bacterium]